MKFFANFVASVNPEIATGILHYFSAYMYTEDQIGDWGIGVVGGYGGGGCRGGGGGVGGDFQFLSEKDRYSIRVQS